MSDVTGIEPTLVGMTSRTGQTLNTGRLLYRYTGKVFMDMDPSQPGAATRSWPRVATDPSRPTYGGCRRPTPEPGNALYDAIAGRHSNRGPCHV